MTFEQSLQDLSAELYRVAPAFALVFFRIAGMFVFAPLLGSAKIPRRVKVLLALVLTLGISAGIKMPAPEQLPQTTWEFAVGIGGELMFGLAMGLILSLVFIAVQWAGEMIGQQMGLNMSEVLDPQFGQAGSLIGDFYYWLCLVVFLTVRGHEAMLNGVRASFDRLPLMSVSLNRSLFNMLVDLFASATMLAIQLAAPMLVTMLIVDLALGCISKTIPQLNVMTAGMSLRSVIGTLVLIVGLTLTSQVMREAVMNAMQRVQVEYATAR
jgi:flagellar biosynthetic protein FliR